MTIKLTLTEAQANALLVAIGNMEGDDNQRLLQTLDRVEEKIRDQKRRRQRVHTSP